MRDVCGYVGRRFLLTLGTQEWRQGGVGGSMFGFVILVLNDTRAGQH